LPQGNELLDVAFDGPRGYAVGAEGTVLRSDDGGRTWSALRSGTADSLSHVQELDPSTVVVGGSCTLSESTDGGATFRRLVVPGAGCTKPVASFSFLTANAGYIELSNGEVLFTGDGGRTVQPRGRVSSAERAGAIDFTSASVGFALASGKSSGEIKRTLDGGDTWTTVATAPAALSDLTFATPTTAYAVGERETLLRSSDAGASWQARPLVLPEHAYTGAFEHIACSDALHCLMTSEPRAYGGSLVVRTSDGGATGTAVDPSEEAHIAIPQVLRVSAVAISSPSTAVVVGEEGATFVSDDGGATFTAPTYRFFQGIPDNHRMRLGRSARDAYIALGEGVEGIAATTDGGASWHRLRVPAREIVDFAFPTMRVGYVVGSEGALFKTTDGGRTWSKLGSVGHAPSAVLAPSPHTVVVIRKGGITLSRDGGKHLRRLDPTVTIPGHGGRSSTARLSSFDVAGDAELAGGAIFAFGDPIFPLVGHGIFADSVLESTDDGLHWTRLASPFPGEGATAISFLSADTGYEACAGRLFFTRDRGRVWREIGSLGVRTETMYPPVNMSFSSALHGYVLAEYGSSEESETLLRTDDGGRSWVPQQLPRFTAGLSQVKAGGAVDYAIGESPQTIYRTTDGGHAARGSALTLAVAGTDRVTASRLRRRGGLVRLAGRLRPALPGAQITIAYSSRGGYYWIHRVVKVNARGMFGLTVRGIRKTTRFVAQWSGTESRSGAGTPATELIVTRHP
jgi:photosystem II stability/assembly factor-like uncharacterized protein